MWSWIMLTCPLRISVFIPEGPGWAIRLGERLEARTMHSLMPWIGLRRMLICRRLR